MSDTVDQAEKELNPREFLEVFAVPGGRSIADIVHPNTGLGCYSNETLEQLQVRYPGAVKMMLADFCKAKAASQDTPVVWDIITEEHYDEWFQCLPPAFNSRHGFMVGEPSDHHALTGRPRYQACRQQNDKYYASSRPMTIAEYREAVKTPIA